MKIAQINTYDIQGGAARAAYRLHQGLLLTGHHSILLSKYRISADPTVQQIAAISGVNPAQESSFSAIQTHYINENRTPLSNTLFSLPYPGTDLSQLQSIVAADVINLHWVADFQSPITIKRLAALEKPMIWTLHDMWAFTGGCHYSAGCRGYQLSCNACPQLMDDPFDLAAVLLKDKLECFSKANLTIVAPSRWLSDCARQSQLFKRYRVEVIPYSLETESLFTPLEKPIAKQILGIPAETITLLFGAGTATEARKGFAELVQTIQVCLKEPRFRQLAADGKLEILCFGYPSELLSDLRDQGVSVRSFGAIDSDHRLSQIYAAADLLVLPSLEDNLPNTMLEAMSCGTPVVAFAVGGILDLVEDRVTGRVAPLRDTQKLAEAILDCIFDPEQRQAMGRVSRQHMVENYAMPVQAQRYLALYQELLKANSRVLYRDSTMTGTNVTDALETSTGDSLGQIANQLALNIVTANLQQTQATLKQLKVDFQRSQLELRQIQLELEQEKAANCKLSTANHKLKAVFSTEQQITTQLRTQLQSSEIVRAQLIQELRHSNEHLRHRIQEIHTAYNQQIQEAKQSTNALRKQLKTKIKELTQQNAELTHSVEQLDCELQYLSTSRAAIRKLLKTMLRKIGLYNFVYQNSKSFVSFYNLCLRDKWKPATLSEGKFDRSEANLQKTLELIPDSTAQLQLSQPKAGTGAQPQVDDLKFSTVDMEASVIEALVVARSLGLEIRADSDLSTLEFLSDLIQQIKTILCVEPPPTVIPLLQSFAKQGAKVICVGCQVQDEPTLQNYGLQATNLDLGTWMMQTGQTDLCYYDAIYLNPETSEENLLLLQGRLAPHAKIITSDATVENSYV
jgi:glycosyltransferase involved in cell wall biosynthesis